MIDNGIWSSQILRQILLSTAGKKCLNDACVKVGDVATKVTSMAEERDADTLQFQTVEVALLESQKSSADSIKHPRCSDDP